MTHASAPFQLPATQHAIRFVGPDQLVLDPAKPVVPPGPTQVLVRVEAVSLCFSDTKLLHAFSRHPRKSEVLGGIDPAVLAEIPSYVPGELPVVPGHEVACRIVMVGSAVSHHRVGERCLVQTDYRHLPTASSNAAFGYTFEGGLQEYVLLDERVIIEPGTGERFLIPVSDAPSASSIALLEPWACVERSYASQERATLRAGGRFLVVAGPGRTVRGLDTLLRGSAPARATVVADDAGTAGELVALLASAGCAVETAVTLDGLPAGAFDDVVVASADGEVIERLQDALAPGGVLDVVLGGERVGRPVSVDVGRVHYDGIRWVGTSGAAADAGYAMAPADGELRAGDRVVVIGAAGPMGFMHAVRTASSALSGVELVAADIDPERLAHLAAVVSPVAARQGIRATFVDSRQEPLDGPFDYLALMVPAPALVSQAVELAGSRARINLFAGFALGTRAAIDLDRLLAKGAYLFGTSGSGIEDMQRVLAKLERGELDTDLSVDSVSGMAGVAAALAAMGARTSGGKIVVYPQLHDTGMIRLVDLAARVPAVAPALSAGRWNRDAEDAFLDACR